MLAMNSGCEPEKIRRRWPRWFSHCVATPSRINALRIQCVTRLVAGKADDYLARINNCCLLQLAGSSTRSLCAHLWTNKGLALYLGRFFLQPLSHIDLVQLSYVINSCCKIDSGKRFYFATSLKRKDTAHQIRLREFFSDDLRQKVWTRMCKMNQ
jgi:hypothetical protein